MKRVEPRIPAEVTGFPCKMRFEYQSTARQSDAGWVSRLREGLRSAKQSASNVLRREIVAESISIETPSPDWFELPESFEEVPSLEAMSEAFAIPNSSSSSLFDLLD